MSEISKSEPETDLVEKCSEAHLEEVPDETVEKDEEMKQNGEKTLEKEKEDEIEMEKEKDIAEKEEKEEEKEKEKKEEEEKELNGEMKVSTPVKETDSIEKEASVCITDSSEDMRTTEIDRKKSILREPRSPSPRARAGMRVSWDSKVLKREKESMRHANLFTYSNSNNLSIPPSRVPTFSAPVHTSTLRLSAPPALEDTSTSSAPINDFFSLKSPILSNFMAWTPPGDTPDQSGNSDSDTEPAADTKGSRKKAVAHVKKSAKPVVEEREEW